ncbi:MAG: hypothetical protein ACO3C5_08065, partial [Ilumatobacteraceae bacterium]
MGANATVVTSALSEAVDVRVELRSSNASVEGTAGGAIVLVVDDDVEVELEGAEVATGALVVTGSLV